MRREIAMAKCENSKHTFISGPLAIIICAAMLIGTTFAWFSASTTAGTATISTPTYVLSYIVDDTDEVALSDGDNTFSLTSGEHKISIKATGTDGATGYCSVKIGENIYYTDQISAVGTLSFTINAGTESEITFSPKWGSCAVRTDDNKIAKGEIITIAAVPSNEIEDTTVSEPEQAPITEEESSQDIEEVTTSETSEEVSTSTVDNDFEETQQDETTAVDVLETNL